MTHPQPVTPHFYTPLLPTTLQSHPYAFCHLTAHTQLMTSAFGPFSGAQAHPFNADGGTQCDVNRKRSLFLDFLHDTLLRENSGNQALGSHDGDAVVALLKQAPAPSAELINDLSGTHSAGGDQQQQAPRSKHTASAGGQQPAQAQQQQHLHRAIITGMPALTRGASNAAADNDDDTSSAVTLPMPDRKRRRGGGGGNEDDEACSSPNDLVEMPSAASTAAAAAAAAAASSQHHSKRSRTAHAYDARSARDQAGSSAAAAKKAAAAAAGNGAAAAAQQQQPAAGEDAGPKRGIVVAKVLTKSDATSKRIILPRIAVETNLPQLASAPAFHFSATDPAGASWPLVIKAWANGSNPKPVYVLEQIGEVLKANKLTVGDAVALLADEDAAFFLEWNTAGALAAAARPTASGVVFRSAAAREAAQKEAAAAQAQQQQQQQGGSSSASVATGEAGAAASTPAGDSGAAAAQQQQQQARAGKPPLAPSTAAAAAAAAPPASAACSLAPAPSYPLPEIEQLGQQLPAHLTQGGAGAVSAAQQQQQAAAAPLASAALAAAVSAGGSEGPYMTAVPVTSPQVPGTFIPTSPCQLLVMGHLPMPDLELELAGPPQPSLPPGMGGGGAGAGAGAGGGDGSSFSGSEEALLVPTGGPAFAAGGSVLLCPRTPGCTRPAGHQGWCLGHKGYKKRRA